jgi:hypothetical protein
MRRPGRAGSPARDQFDTLSCYLVDDLRLKPESCRGARQTSGNGWLVAPIERTGYHYLFMDFTAGSPNHHVNVVSSGSNVPPDPPNHDTCAGARVLPRGSFSFADNLDAATNDYDPGPGGCLSEPGTIRDVVYRADLNPGDGITLSMVGNGDWDEALYLVTDCGDVTGTCVAAGSRDGEGVRLDYVSASGGVFYLICDSYGPGAMPFTLAGELGDVLTTTPNTPAVIVLEPCFPNPFNPRTTIVFSLPEAQQCRLAIYGPDGRCIRTLIDGVLAPGRQEVEWDGRDNENRPLPSGAYVYRLEAGSQTLSRRMLLLK